MVILKAMLTGGDIYVFCDAGDGDGWLMRGGAGDGDCVVKKCAVDDDGADDVQTTLFSLLLLLWLWLLLWSWGGYGTSLLPSPRPMPPSAAWS